MLGPYAYTFGSWGTLHQQGIIHPVESQ